jgi:hypothetical protein
LGPAALGWHGQGHQRITRTALKALPATMPAFLREGAATIAHCVVDPDLVRHKATPQLSAHGSPDHYLDYEALQGKTLPPTRYQFVRLIDEMKMKPEDVGMLPYALIEETQRLTIAFAEHRRFPDDPNIRAKCLVYAGALCHYAQDATQPLHTTIHHDGRARPDGTSPRSGIHSKVDGLIERVPIDEAEVLRDLNPQPLPDLWKGILAEIDRSRALVDKVYELEPQLPDARTPPPYAPAVVEFTRDRYRAAARFTASLIMTAWENSVKVDLPAWLIETRELPGK